MSVVFFFFFKWISQDRFGAILMRFSIKIFEDVGLSLASLREFNGIFKPISRDLFICLCLWGGGGFRYPISGSLKKDLKIICVSMSFENISLELFVGFFGISFFCIFMGDRVLPGSPLSTIN